MGSCSHCGEDVLYPFECSFCGDKFCNHHRLPENHGCTRSPQRTPLGPWYAKKAPKGKPIRISSQPIPTSKKRVASEGKFHFVKGETQSRKKRSVKKLIGGAAVVVVIGLILWNAPSIVAIVQNLISPYTKLTITKSSPTEIQATIHQFGDTEYTFVYHWTGHLSVSTPLLETETFIPVEGAIHEEFGIEIKVPQIFSDSIEILVRSRIQDYLAKSSYRELIIAQGQFQTVSFSGNEYTISYIHDPPYHANQLTVATILMEWRQYYAVSSQIIDCDLGLEIRVYRATPEHIRIFVKPTY